MRHQTTIRGLRRLLVPLAAAACLPLASVALAEQAGPPGRVDLSSGQAIYQAGCAGCHGPDGRGMADSTLGFDRPATFPDFTDCASTTPEFDIGWKATIRDGGPGRGFSPIMPSFRDLLTSEQIDAVIVYLRTLCRSGAWPRAELNLPRPLATEKAFPESETVLTTTIAAKRAPDVGNAVTYERRVGTKSQIELSVPVDFVHTGAGALNGGVGDIGIGVKHVLFASHRTGTILSAQGEAVLPTGSRDRGLGTGVTVFEVFGAFAQLLPGDGFVQLQAGTEQPRNTEETPRVVFGRVAIGKSFREEHGFGRLWSPMLEVLTERELLTGASADVDLLPQFQVTLSRRQHVRANVGVQFPVTNTAGRPKQILFYLLWDWFDGGFLEGWK